MRIKGLLVYPDDRSEWGRWQPRVPPTDARETAWVLDDSGAQIAEIEVARVPLSDSDTITFLLPDPEQDWAVLELGDRTVDLTETEPAK